MMRAYVRLYHPLEADPYDKVPGFSAKVEWPKGMRIPNEGETIEWDGNSFHVHVVHHFPQPTEGDGPYTYLVIRQSCRGGHR